jgi:hypothetical protein
MTMAGRQRHTIRMNRLGRPDTYQKLVCSSFQFNLITVFKSKFPGAISMNP